MSSIFLKKTLLAFVSASLCIVISYLFLDRPIAFWMNSQDFSRFPFFNWMTLIAVGIGALAAIFLVVFSILAVKRPLKKEEKILLFASTGVTVACFLKEATKVVFGRYWIQTWIDQNPSLLENGAYGFHFLHSGTAYGSFPSGHTAIACSAMTFLWYFAPKWRFLAILLVFVEAFGLLALNFHFLSDILAGAFLGVFSSLFVIQLAKLSR